MFVLQIFLHLNIILLTYLLFTEETSGGRLLSLVQDDIQNKCANNDSRRHRHNTEGEVWATQILLSAYGSVLWKQELKSSEEV